MKSNIFLLILATILTSCGTLYGYKDIILLDSTPRNLQVSDEDGHFLSNTPFFHRASPKRKQTYIFSGEDKNGNKFKREELLRCRIEWGQSIIPAATLLLVQPIGVALTGISLGVDAISGGIYECSKTLKPDLRAYKPITKKQKRKILILPPYILDEVVGNKIIDEWTKEQFALNKTELDELIPPKDTKEEFEYLGITNERHVRPTRLKRKFLLRLGYKHQLTHIMYFRVTETSNEYRIKPVLYDAFTMQRIKSHFEDQFVIEKDEHLFKTHVRWLLKAITILPNTFQIGYTSQPDLKVTSDVYDISKYDTDNDGDIDSNRHPNSIPKVLTAFTLGVAENPYHFSTWDVNFSIYPTFSSSSWQSYLKNNTSDYTIQLYNFNAFLNAGLTFHTIIGAVGANIGMGAIWFLGKDSLGTRFNHVDHGLRVNLSYVAFLSERFYFRADYSNYQVKGHKVDTPSYRLDSWSEIYLAAGYYFPSIRTIVRKILPF